MSTSSGKQRSTSKTKRQHFPRCQLDELEKSFQQSRNPTSLVKEQLAEKLGTTKKRIQIWFQNRRTKAKRQLAKQSSTAEAIVAISSTHRRGTPAEDPMPPAQVDVITQSVDLSTYSIAEMTPRQLQTEVPQLILYQPTYAINTADTSRHRHPQYYPPSIYLAPQHQIPTDQLQQSNVISPLPSVSAIQHQSPSSQTTGLSVIDSRQNHPVNYIPVIPNPSVSYLLSHENQQSHQTRRYQH